LFFNKRLRDPSLKNPRSLEEMLAIANKYALAEEATLNNKESKKDKEPSQSD
jgi:hypothetical protein